MVYFLEEDGYGVYAVVIAIVSTIGMLGTLGISSAITKYISEEDAEDLLKKIGAKKIHIDKSQLEQPAPVKEEKVEEKPKKRKKRTDMKIPDKTPEPTKTEKEIQDHLEKNGTHLPSKILSR